MYDNSNTMPDLVQKAVGLFKISFRQCFPIAFAMVLIDQLFAMVSRENIAVINNQIQVKHFPVIIASILLVAMINTFFSIVFQIILASRAKKMYCHYVVAFKLASTLFLRVLVATVIVWALVSVGFMLMVIPAFFLCVMFAMYLPVLIFEGLSPIEALKRSYKLISLQPFSTAGLVLLRWILTYAPVFVVTIFIPLPNNATDYGVDQMLIIFLNALLMPFIQGTVICQYLTLRKLEKEHEKELKDGQSEEDDKSGS